MRIAIVTSSPPFSEGGHLVIARALVRACEEAGHQAAIVITPQNRFGRQGAAYIANWFTDVGVTSEGLPVDHVISLRYPSYAVRHPSHVCWLNHTMREYYDLWERFSAPLSEQGRLKERVRRTLIHQADRYLLTRNVRKLFVQSRTVQGRLSVLGSVASEVLYPPPPPRPYRCDEYGDFVLAVSRQTPLKRLDLLLRALAEPAAEAVRCVVAGEGEEEGALKALARGLRVDDRVTFAGGVSDEQLVDYLARCRAVCFTPLSEDYGFVAAEAFASRKPLVTCHDSGGPAELAAEGRGIIVDARPAQVAGALASLIGDRDRAQRIGAAGHAFISTLTWRATLDRLLLH